MGVDHMIHTPVLQAEVSHWLSPAVQSSSLCIDATVGEGGHSAALLEAHPQLRMICIDRDYEMIVRAKARLKSFTARIQFVEAWFDEFLATYRGPAPQGILFDLGISMAHFRGSHGFSFRTTAPLDMRLDRGQHITAAHIVQRASLADLSAILKEYGEEPFATRIAQRIVEARGHRAISDTLTLNKIIMRAVPPRHRRGGIHPVTRSYQALRIAVNNELERLKRALPRALHLLVKGGRMLCIAFHSLEDRIVKHTLRDFQHKNRIEILTPRPLSPTSSERMANPACRSARLRVAQKNTSVDHDE